MNGDGVITCETSRKILWKILCNCKLAIEEAKIGTKKKGSFNKKSNQNNKTQRFNFFKGKRVSVLSSSATLTSHTRFPFPPFIQERVFLSLFYFHAIQIHGIMFFGAHKPLSFAVNSSSLLQSKSVTLFVLVCCWCLLLLLKGIGLWFWTHPIPSHCNTPICLSPNADGIKSFLSSRVDSPNLILNNSILVFNFWNWWILHKGLRLPVTWTMHPFRGNSLVLMAFLRMSRS